MIGDIRRIVARAGEGRFFPGWTVPSSAQPTHDGARVPRTFPTDARTVIAAIACVAIVGVTFLRVLAHGGDDFDVFYLTGQRALAGEPLYRVADALMVFKYHPVWAIVFTAFVPLPEWLGQMIFHAMMLGCWFWAAAIWARWLGYDLGRPVNLLILLLVSYNALAAELNFGQINGLLMLGATKLFDWMSETPQRWFRAGVLFTVLCSMKLSFGLVAVFCLVRNVRSLAGMLAGVIALHVVTALFFGGWTDVALYRSWIDVLLRQSESQYTDPYAQGVLRFLLTLSPAYGRALWLACVVIAAGAGVYLERYRQQAPALVAAFWLAAFYLLSPLAWWYQLLFMFPLLFFLLRQGTGRAVLFICLAIYALASPAVLTHAGNDAFRAHLGYFYASMAILGVMVVSLWRSRSAAADFESATIGPRSQTPLQ